MNFPRIQVTGIVLLAMLCLPTVVAKAQTDSDQAKAKTKKQGQDVENPAAIQFGDPVETFWEFGLQIKSNGKSSGVYGVAPVPLEWPEQKIEIVREDKSPGVGRVTFKTISGGARVMSYKASRLAPGQSADCKIRYKITKQMIYAPQDINKLKIAKSVPSKIKQFLRPSPYIETTNKSVKAAAAKIVFNEKQTDWDKIETIYRWVRENIEYKFDTQIHTCMHALENGHGDCEELSSLFIAICRIKGIPARAVWIPGHTYPEFYLEDDKGEGHWFPCQAAGSYSFGEMLEARPILQKGDKFKVRGHSKPIRYIQATAGAKDSSAGMSIGHISQEVDSTGTRK